MAGDLNNHVGKDPDGFENPHWRKWYGNRNPEKIWLLNVCIVNSIALTKTFFEKSKSQLIAYCSEGSSTQIDYILAKWSDLKFLLNMKVVGVYSMYYNTN